MRIALNLSFDYPTVLSSGYPLIFLYELLLLFSLVLDDTKIWFVPKHPKAFYSASLIDSTCIDSMSTSKCYRSVCSLVYCFCMVSKLSYVLSLFIRSFSTISVSCVIIVDSSDSLTFTLARTSSRSSCSCGIENTYAN